MDDGMRLLQILMSLLISCVGVWNRFGDMQLNNFHMSQARVAIKEELGTLGTYFSMNLCLIFQEMISTN